MRERILTRLIKTFLRTWLVAAISFLLCDISISAPRISRAKACSRLLGLMAYQVDELRSQHIQEFWRLYKNDDIFYSWLKGRKNKFEISSDSIVDLVAAYKSASASSEQKPYKSKSYVIAKELLSTPLSDRQSLDVSIEAQTSTMTYRFTFVPTLYEKIMLDIRKGDTLVYGKNRIKLGKYLGGGNSNHIYEVESQPGAVIRLPFPARIGDFFGIRLREVPADSAAQAAVESTSSFIEIEPKIVAPHVKILSVDPNNLYVMVEKVEGAINGRDFLLRALSPHFRKDLAEEAYGGWWEQLILKFMHDYLRVVKTSVSRYVTPSNAQQTIEVGTDYFYKRVSDSLSGEDKEMLAKLRQFSSKIGGVLPYVVPKVETEHGPDKGRIWDVDVDLYDGAEEVTQISSINALRQAVFDRKKRKWILVDWDIGDELFFKNWNSKFLVEATAKLVEELTN